MKILSVYSDRGNHKNYNRAPSKKKNVFLTIVMCTIYFKFNKGKTVVLILN